MPAAQEFVEHVTEPLLLREADVIDASDVFDEETSEIHEEQDDILVTLRLGDRRVTDCNFL